MVYNSSTIIMKKLFYSVICLLIMGLTVASCEKPNTENEDDNKDNVENTNPDDDNKDDDNQNDDNQNDNNQNDDNNNQNATSDCRIYSAQYGVDATGAVYVFELLTNDIEISADATSISGSGDDCIIMMYATPQEDGYPVAKEYPVIPLEELSNEDTECVIGGTVMQGQPIGTFAYVIEEGQAVDGLLCVGGSVKFEGNATNGTMTANFEFMNTQGETVERTYIYSGKMELEEMPMSAPSKVKRIK